MLSFSLSSADLSSAAAAAANRLPYFQHSSTYRKEYQMTPAASKTKMTYRLRLPESDILPNIGEQRVDLENEKHTLSLGHYDVIDI